MADNHDNDKPPVTDAEIRAEVEKTYGFMSWALDHPELGPILFQAAREGWDEARLRGAVEATTWFRTNSQSARAFDEEEATDPASANRKIEAAARQIIETAKRVGVNITPERAQVLARNAVRNGLTETEVEAAVRQEFKYKPDSTIDKASGRLAFVGPNGEPGWDPNDPNKPANAQIHTMPDGRQAAYLPGDFDVSADVANSGGRPELLAAQKEQTDRGVKIAPGTVFAPGPNNTQVLIDVRTGRPAFRGPQGEAGYDPADPNKPANAVEWVMPDGRRVAYVPASTGPRQTETVTQPLAPAADDLRARLQQLVDAYLLPTPDSELGRWVTDIIQGKATEDQFTTWIKAEAMSAWPQFKAAIQAGQTVRQFLANYGGIVERELGIPYEQIDWTDPKWRRAIFKHDPNTGQVGVMDLFEWEQTLKTDETYGWDKTPGGREQWSKMATGITSVMKGVR